MKTIIAVLLIVLINATAIHAGIPEPDMTLFGEVSVGGRSIGSHDDVSIIARIDGRPDSLVGAYRMGDNPAAGDFYVLRIRIESLADGAQQSPNAASSGQKVNIYVRTSDFLEVYAASVTISESGTAQYLGLHSGSIVFSDADLNTDGIVNLRDLAKIARYWNRKDCGEPNDWCDGADIGHSTAVDLSDLLEVATAWLDIAKP